MTELLAPAGGPEALRSAVYAGADAVYFGAQGFNARAEAGNFGPDELAEAFSFCRIYGVKAYVTLNTLVSDRELPEALSLVDSLCAFIASIGFSARYSRPNLSLVQFPIPFFEKESLENKKAERSPPLLCFRIFYSSFVPSHRKRARSTQPLGLKQTPSASSNARCSGHPGAGRPKRLTTRWQG